MALGWLKLYQARCSQALSPTFLQAGWGKPGCSTGGVCAGQGAGHTVDGVQRPPPSRCKMQAGGEKCYVGVWFGAGVAHVEMLC